MKHESIEINLALVPPDTRCDQYRWSGRNCSLVPYQGYG